MAIAALTLDQDALRRIVEHRDNVRKRFLEYVAILENGTTVVKSAKCFFAGEADLYIGDVVENIKLYKERYETLDTEFNTLYAGYAASQWNTDVDAAIAALSAMYTYIETQFNTNFLAVDPAGKYFIENLSAGQKTAFATQIKTMLGIS